MLPWEGDPAERLMRCFGEMDRQNFYRIHSEQLRPGERAVLFALKFAQGEQLRANELAAQLNVTAPSITSVMNRLEERGYLQRQIAAKDRRVVLVSLTESGREVLQEHMVQVAHHFTGLAEYLGEHDTEELLRLMQKILEYCGANPWERRAGQHRPHGDSL